jgi:hypothetical protein
VSEDDGEAWNFLTAKQAERYGKFEGAPSTDELERFFFLDDSDRALIAKRRGDSNRLGFALQLTTVRFLGTFLDDPLDVPVVVLDDLAAQLDIAEPSCVKAYVEREMKIVMSGWGTPQTDVSGADQTRQVSVRFSFD